MDIAPSRAAGPCSAQDSMPKPPNTPPLGDLDRLWFMPTPGLGSWRVSLRCRGTNHAKGFPVLRHGSVEAALQAAQAWRDQIARSLQPYTQQELVQKLRTNNTSGTPGVFKMKTSRRRSDGSVAVYVHWEARTPEGVKPARKKAFSISRYGEEKAYELAVAARAAFVQALADSHQGG